MKSIGPKAPGEENRKLVNYPAVPPNPQEPITIAIPFYKGAEYLRLAIASVISQSSPNWKLIVCDDGPEPGIDQLVASFNDQRIRYFKNPRNLGMAGNWNRCLELADTDLVQLLHNDDQLLPNYVEEMLRASQTFPHAAAYFCKARIIDRGGKPVFSTVDYIKRFLQPRTDQPIILEGPPAIESPMHGNFIMCPTVCYRRSRLGSERFDGRLKFVLDLEFYLRLLLRGETIIGLPATAYAYRRHDENATSIYTETMTRFEEESALHDSVAKLASERGWDSLKKTAARKRMLKLHLLFRIASDLTRCRYSSANRKWKLLRAILGEPIKEDD